MHLNIWAYFHICIVFSVRWRTHVIWFSVACGCISSWVKWHSFVRWISLLCVNNSTAGNGACQTFSAATTLDKVWFLGKIVIIIIIFLINCLSIKGILFKCSLLLPDSKFQLYSCLYILYRKFFVTNGIFQGINPNKSFFMNHVSPYMRVRR